MQLIVFFTILLIALPPLIAGETRVKSLEISSDESPGAIARAKQQGTQTALADIKAGHPVILYYGEPWSGGKPLIDDVTGLPVEIVGGCVVTGTFTAEVNAYNDIVREWHDKSKATATPR